MIFNTTSGNQIQQARNRPPRMRRPGASISGIIVLLLLAFVSTACTGPASDTSTSTIPVTIRGHELQVELATTPEERQQGLMFREDLPPDGGMLFVFPNEQVRSFWMKNTPLPLSIAFLDSNRRILNIAAMQPFDEVSRHLSAGPARYALEVHQGWFAERGITAGDVCEFQLPPDVRVQ